MKRIFTILCTILLIGTINAQENTEKRDKHIVSFRAGYSIPVSNSQIGSPISEIGKTFRETKANGTTVVSEKNSYGSRGAGLNFSLGYEYMITPNFSIGLDFSYIYTLGITDAFILQQSGSTITYDAKQESYTSMFRATPLVGVYANKNLLIRPYAKFGVIIPFAGATYASLKIVDETGIAFNELMPIIDNDLFQQIDTLSISVPVPTSTDIEAISLGAFSIGFDARIGAEYQITNHLNLFVELNMQTLTVKTGKSVITKFESSTTDEMKALGNLLGIDVKDFALEDIPEYLRVTEYVDEINESSNVYGSASYDGSKASNQLASRENYNAFGFLIGIKYGF